MKLQTILLLAGTAAGLMTVSCKSPIEALDEEAEAFFGHPAPNRARIEAEEKAKASADKDYYAKVNEHIDRRLNEFNEKEEVKLPVFASKEARDEFKQLSFIQSAQRIGLLSIDFSCTGDKTMNFVFDRESRTFARTFDGVNEEFAFEPFTNGVRPDIPYYAHILYAFVTDFDRIAENVTLRCFDKLEDGENPAIAALANAANINEKGEKIDKNYVELKPKVVSEPQEYRIDKRWCQCYDVKLKSICQPAVAMSIFVSNDEKTISRIDLIFDDDSKTSFIMDWREQDGIVLPRVIRRLSDNEVFFREDAKVISNSARAFAEALSAADAVDAESANDDASAQNGEDGEEDMVEFDLSAGNGSEEEDSAMDEEQEDGTVEEDESEEDESEEDEDILFEDDDFEEE